MGAKLLAALAATIFPAILYLSPSARFNRNSPGTIRVRMFYVSLVAGLTTVFGPALATKYVGGTTDENLAALQLDFNGPAILKALGITMLAYLGPLLAGRYSLGSETKLIRFRNLVVGPVTEELVYRSFIVGVYKQAGISDTRIIWETPLYFGVAHLHHAVVEIFEGANAGQAALEALMQLTITTLFGAYAAKLFLSLGTVWASVIAHSFCNAFGAPSLSGSIGYKLLLFTGLGLFGYCLRLI